MRSRCVSGHVGRSSQICHRNAFTEKASEGAVQGLGKVETSTKIKSSCSFG